MFMKSAYWLLLLFLLAGCSVFGNSSVEIAPYRVIETNSEQNIELRYYKKMILVSAPMQADMNARKQVPFSKLFDYISGNNTLNAEISMTAPVLLSDDESKGVKIPMTAPVFMAAEDELSSMSFVMPTSYTLDTTPKPKDPELKLNEIKDMTYAVIQFNGLLNSKNIQNHRKSLENWINTKDLEVTGRYKVAGYNPPFTIPAFRRNEVLIPVKPL